MSMRVSIDPKDPGYVHFLDLQTEGYTIAVELDGEEVLSVVTADEEKGFVIAVRFTPEGRVCRDGENTVYETRRGKVKIKPRRVWDDRVLH